MDLSQAGKDFLKQTFPNSKIINTKYLPEGMSSNVFLISLENPDRKVILKEFKLKRLSDIKKDIAVQQLIKSKGFKSFSVLGLNPKGIVILENIEGKVGSQIFKESAEEDRVKIIQQAAINLKKIHSLFSPSELPIFWQNSKITITSSEDWINWTKLRTEKYLKFSEEHFDTDILNKIKTTFTWLNQELNANPPEIKPLHWDYHLDNLIFDENFNINATLDFAAAMPGDWHADLGQVLYWQLMQLDTSKYFDTFLNAYDKAISKKDFKLIEAYYLLHLLAVSRNTWDRPALDWLQEKHKILINEFQLN